jgi:protein-tyrosine phosphatase
LLRVLFVCTGNICRSPTAEGILRARLEAAGLGGRVEVDSAATHGYHVGEPPDPRSQEAALRRGVDLSDQQARRVAPGDFAAFDLVIAMDSGHADALRRMAPPGEEERVRLFLLDFAPQLGITNVPDPYYGGADGFERVLDLIEAAADGLIDEIRREHLRE